jgi:hypothetical protein
MLAKILESTKSIGATCAKIDINPTIEQSVSLLSCTLINLIQALRTTVIGIGVLFVVIAGVQFVTSNGNPDKINQAKQTLTWALISLVLASIIWAVLIMLSGIYGVPGVTKDIQLNLPPQFD